MLGSWRRRMAVILMLALMAALFIGCGTADLTKTQTAVSIQRVDNAYYLAKVDFTGSGHQEMGAQYARSIQKACPDYEKIVDSLLKDQFGALSAAKEHFGYEVTFALAKSRATDIKANIAPEYQEEIAGMSSVFNYNQDVLGDGRLSSNELLVYLLFADVLRPTQCSATAAYASASDSGATVLGRNLDWDFLPNNDAAKLHTVMILKNGPKSIVMINFLGQLVPISGFSDDKIFVAVLDAETGAAYPPTADKRSYMFDLRYALENHTTLDDIVKYIGDKPYAFNHLVFIADAKTAGVMEENIGSPARGLRRGDSPALEGLAWGIPDTVCTVNDFRLPGNFHTSPPAPADQNRWLSYQALFNQQLATGKINLDKMKIIAGYPGQDGTAIGGAVFRSDAIPSIQSVVMRMDTLETWVHFEPEGKPPVTPSYIQVFARSPFES